MQNESSSNRDQAALWNGTAGLGWVAAQEVLDRLLAPFERVLVAAVATRRPARVLDVGCGTGATSLAIARELGAHGECTGLDISEPMIALARSRAASEPTPPKFVCADAQTYAFEPASVDMIVSRFGVMFFDDPVRAFENLRRAAAPDAALECIAWRGAAENPFMTAAERAAAPFLPSLPPRNAEEPGQFAFGDRNRVEGILERSGWSDVAMARLDLSCTLPERDLETYLTRIGPVGRALQDADEPTRARVVASVRAAFEPYIEGSSVRFTAACWVLSARAAAVAATRAQRDSGGSGCTPSGSG